MCKLRHVTHRMILHTQIIIYSRQTLKYLSETVLLEVKSLSVCLCIIRFKDNGQWFYLNGLKVE